LGKLVWIIRRFGNRADDRFHIGLSIKYGLRRIGHCGVAVIAISRFNCRTRGRIRRRRWQRFVIINFNVCRH
jgi:hypothetical protein